MTREQRLARIINVKQRISDARRGELAEAEQARDVAEKAADSAAASLDQVAERYSRPSEISAGELGLRAQAVRSAQAGYRQARARLEEAGLERERRAQAAVLAGRESRSLEILQARHEAERKIVERRAEQAALDEAARTGAA